MKIEDLLETLPRSIKTMEQAITAIQSLPIDADDIYTPDTVNPFFDITAQEEKVKALLLKPSIDILIAKNTQVYEEMGELLDLLSRTS